MAQETMNYMPRATTNTDVKMSSNMKNIFRAAASILKHPLTDVLILGGGALQLNDSLREHSASGMATGAVMAVVGAALLAGDLYSRSLRKRSQPMQKNELG